MKFTLYYYISILRTLTRDRRTLKGVYALGLLSVRLLSVNADFLPDFAVFAQTLAGFPAGNSEKK